MSMTLYARLIGLCAVMILAVVWGIASWLLPMDGDLARVGGYSENEFGLREPQTVFAKNHFTLADSLEDYDRRYDVVVLGDSFSVDQVERFFGWQNYFIARTGLSMIVFDTRRYWPVEVYDSPQFKKYPPKVFVFETVERYLHERVAYFSRMTPPARNAGEPVAREIYVEKKESEFPTSERMPNPQADFDPSHAIGHLGAIVQRRLHLNNQVVEVPLAKGGMFSSRNDTDLLVYFDEFKKQTLTPQNVADLRAGAGVFRKIIEANGVTRFVLIVAPDKTSAFAPYLKDGAKATANLIAELAKDPTLPVPRTDLVLAQAISSGKKDVYLPNDSHWGSIGHKLFAETLVEHLAATKNQPVNTQ